MCWGFNSERGSKSAFSSASISTCVVKFSKYTLHGKEGIKLTKTHKHKHTQHTHLPCDTHSHVSTPSRYSERAAETQVGYAQTHTQTHIHTHTHARTHAHTHTHTHWPTKPHLQVSTPWEFRQKCMVKGGSKTVFLLLQLPSPACEDPVYVCTHTHRHTLTQTKHTHTRTHTHTHTGRQQFCFTVCHRGSLCYRN